MVYFFGFYYDEYDLGRYSKSGALERKVKDAG